MKKIFSIILIFALVFQMTAITPNNKVQGANIEDNVSTYSDDNEKPVISFRTEKIYSTTGTKPCLSASATDASGEEPVMSYEWSKGALDEAGRLTKGTHTWTIKAKNTAGKEAVKAVTVYVTDKEDYGTNLVDECVKFCDKVFVEAKPATFTTNGNIEHWYCDDCDRYYADALGTKELSASAVTIKAKGKVIFNGDFTTDEGAMDFEGWNGITAGEVKDKINKNVKYSWDFDDGVPTGWRNVAAASNLNHSKDGASAVKVTAKGQPLFETDNGNLQKLDANKDYIISMWVYSETAGVIGLNANLFYDDDWKLISGRTVTTNISVKANEWTLITHKIEKFDHPIIVQPNIVHGDDNADIYIDDVEIYSTDTVVNKKEVTVKLYDFEDGTIDLIQEDSKGNKPELSVVKEGENAVLKSYFNSAWMNFFTHDIGVVEGREYTLSWDVKVESVGPEDGLYTGMAYPRGNQNDYLNFKADRTKINEWQKMSIKYTATGSTVQFAFQLGAQTGVFYYDNIKLSYTEETPVKGVSRDGVVEEGPDGINALAFAQATDLYNDTITTLKKGKTYAYSFYAKTANTEEGFEFKPYISYGSDNVVELNGKQTGDLEWTKYTGTFVADEVTEGEKFKIGFARKGTGDAYVAAIELEEKVVETTPEETTTKKDDAGNEQETTKKDDNGSGQETTKKPETTTKKPVVTTKKPITTTKKPVATTKKHLDKTKITKKPSKKLSSKKVKLTFKKVKKAKKYTVQFSVKKNFKKVLYKKTVKSTKVTISSSKLKNKKKLYVRVRAVGAKKWSSIVTVKVKK